MNHQILQEIPAAIAPMIESMKKDRGYFFITEQKILAVFMGERPTGGYRLSLEDLQVRGGALTGIILETSPKPGDMVTQAFTYPLLLIQLDQAFSTFDIRDQSGKAYPLNGGTAY